MINVLVIVMEGIAAWLCLHCAFGEKIKKSKGEIIFFLFYISLFALCSFGILSRLFYILFWVFAFIWCKVMFGRKKLSTIVRTAIGIVAVGVIETVVVFVYTIIMRDIKVPDAVEYATAGILIMFSSVCLYRISNSIKDGFDKNMHDNGTLMLVLMMVLFLIIVKIEFEIRKTVPITYILFFVVLTTVFIYLCKK